MNKHEFLTGLSDAIIFKSIGKNKDLEAYLRSLKHSFNEDEVVLIEDYLFGLDDKTTNLNVIEFYEYLQTKSLNEQGNEANR
jgi:hypothetical protein